MVSWYDALENSSVLLPLDGFYSIRKEYHQNFIGLCAESFIEEAVERIFMNAWNILFYDTMFFVVFCISRYVQLLISLAVNCSSWKVEFDLKFYVKMKC